MEVQWSVSSLVAQPRNIRTKGGKSTNFTGFQSYRNFNTVLIQYIIYSRIDYILNVGYVYS